MLLGNLAYQSASSFHPATVWDRDPAYDLLQKARFRDKAHIVGEAKLDETLNPTPLSTSRDTPLPFCLRVSLQQGHTLCF